MPRASTLDLEGIKNLSRIANVKENPVTYLSIDPGKWNGVCGYDAKFYLQFMHVIESKDIVTFLQQFTEIKKCIMENYKLFPNKAKEQYYSDMETPRVIGRVEAWADVKGVQVIKQPSSIKNTGYAWVGEKPPSKNSNKNDPMDAHVHFIYWAVKNGHINAAELLKKR